VSLSPLHVRALGRRLGFLHRGGEGPTLVFFHGAGQGARHLEPLAAAVRGLEVMVLDAPGRGESEGPALDRTGELARLAGEAMHALGKTAWIACGHSLGGAVAIECALLPPGRRPRAIALLASGARLRVSPAILEAVSSAAQEGEPMLTPPVAFASPDPARLAAAHALDRAIPPASALADWRAADAFDRMEALAEIDLPALVVTGTDDPLTPEKYARFLADRLPRASLVRLEGAGHMFPFERAEETARHLEAFARAQS